MSGKKLCLVLADQLYQQHSALKLECDFVMIESMKACKKLPYHKFRLAYLLTAMRHYCDFLRDKGKRVHYFNLEQNQDFTDVLAELSEKYSTILYCDVDDKPVSYKLRSISLKYFKNYQILESPKFLTTKDQFREYLGSKTTKRLLMQDFYIWQRQRLNLLLDKDNQPLGGKWSLDVLNRQKLPKTKKIPTRNWSYPSTHFETVKGIINKYFPSNPGELNNLWLPITFAQSHTALQNFFELCLADFGDFEDALTDRDNFVFHSVISPMLNLGLLTPQQVILELQSFLQKNPDILAQKLNSVEGFVRQIIGWREWVKGVYDNFYDDNWRSLNFFGSTEPLPRYFYNLQKAYTDKDLEQNTPLRLVLQKVHKLSWCHHIERLMILGNWMTINRYSPSECYDWFRSQFVDAFEWVMVPNVYGMGLFADGGIFATKPYIAGGNYIKKMSDYSDYKNWEKIWTDKFWEFLWLHQKYFSQNPRLNMLLKSKLQK